MRKKASTGDLSTGTRLGCDPGGGVPMWGVSQVLRRSSTGATAESIGGAPPAAIPTVDALTLFLHGLVRAVQTAATRRAVTHRIHPSVVVLTPMHLRPEAKMTKVMIGRTIRSGAL